LLNGSIASFYVLIGSFNGLVTFIGNYPLLPHGCLLPLSFARLTSEQQGIAEYSFFLLSVLGILVLRRAEKLKPNPVATKHNTWIGNPIIFASVSGLLILRAVIAEPLQGLAILVVGLIGLAVFYYRFGSRGFEMPVAI
jgi:L-type amino acid transporter 6